MTLPSNPRHRHLLGTCASALVLALAAAACGSSSSGTSNSVPATLTFGSYTPVIDGFDPAQAQANQQTFLSPVYDTLIRQSTNGDLSGDLASSWQFTTPTDLVLHLRTGVKFSDGEPFNAQAAATSLQHNEQGTGAVVNQLAPISSTSVDNPTTLELHLSKPTASLPATLSSIAGMMEAPKALGSLKTAPVGTGPWIYEPASSTAGAQYSYRSNPGYWAKSVARAPKLQIKVMQNYTAQLNGVQSGQIDLTTIQADQVAQAKSAGLHVSTVPGPALVMELLDRGGQKVPALGNLQVRQALNDAIDRSGIAKSLSDGYAVPSAGFWVPGYWPADPAADKTYSYDPTKAKSLLAAAGYPQGFTIEMGTIAAFQPQAEAIQAQLKAVGVNLQIKVLQNGVLSKAIRANNYPIILTTGGGDASGDPGADVTQAALPNSQSNPEHYEVPGLVALASQGESLSTQAARQPVYRKIDNLLTTQAFNVVIGYEDAIVATSSHLNPTTPVPCGGATCVSFTGITGS